MERQESVEKRIENLEQALDHLIEIAKELRYLTDGEKAQIIGVSIQCAEDFLKNSRRGLP